MLRYHAFAPRLRKRLLKTPSGASTAFGYKLQLNLPGQPTHSFALSWSRPATAYIPTKPRSKQLPRTREFRPAPSRSLTLTRPRAMADDASYAAFLDKANADPKAGYEQSGSTSQARTKFDPTSTSRPGSEALPASLKSLPEVTYTSDTDAPFEPITLSYAGSKLPSVAEFEKTLGPKAKSAGTVEELTTDDFDPRGEYRDIIERVAQAAKNKDVGVTVFRVELSRTRVEYYILTVQDNMLVGVVVKAVES